MDSVLIKMVRMVRVRVWCALMVFYFTVPLFVSAQPVSRFITCSGTDCSACNLADMANEIISWLLGVMFILFAVLMARAGINLITSGGNTSALSAAKDAFVNALIGLVIVLAGWLIVDTIMRGLLLGGNGQIQGYGPWSEVQCQLQTQTHEGTGNSWTATSSLATYGTSTAGVGSGNTGVVDFARAMQNANCIYNQALRNGCQGNPGYTDCSDLVNVAYRAAGCTSPGATTAQQISAASAVGNPSTLQPGDALIYRSGGAGHVVICQDAGCTQVIHAAGTGRNIVTGNSSYYLNRPDIRAIRASNHCP